MSGPRGIVVLEGADATGKTTLAAHLRQRYGARYVHCGVSKNVWRLHVAALRRACRLAERSLVVIDRLWLSEQVYGSTFRGGPAYDLGARCLDRVLLKHAAVTVVCVRRDVEAHLAHFEKLKTERPEKFSDVSKVIQLYADLWGGNLAHLGETYLDQLIRFQDWAARPDTLVYDLDRHGGNLWNFGERVRRKLEELREKQYAPALEFSRQNFAGFAPAARYLFVGEAMTPNHPPKLPRWPFFSDDRLNSATWLNRALRSLGFDETSAVWTNALEADGHLDALLDRYGGLRVVAFGREAERALAKDWSRIDVRPVAHPQYARRFRAKDFDAYVREIGRALA